MKYLTSYRFKDGQLVDPAVLEYGTTLELSSVSATDDYGVYSCRFNNDAISAESDPAILNVQGNQYTYFHSLEVLKLAYLGNWINAVR